MLTLYVVHTKICKCKNTIRIGLGGMSKIIKKIGSLGKVSAKYINDNGIAAFSEKVLEKIDKKYYEHNYNKKFKAMSYIEKKIYFKY